MRRLYSLLMLAAAPLLLIYLWWRGRKDADYRLRWGERFGLRQAAAHAQGGVVLHCASVGEAIAAGPLIELLLASPLTGPLVLTCTTPTGSRMLRARYGTRGAAHCYFPIDLPGATGRFLRALQPRLVLLLERELWPNFLHQARLNGVPVALVNARLSASSAATYARWRSLMQPALRALSLVCAEDSVSAARFLALGVADATIERTGNIKSDIVVAPELREKVRAQRQLLGARPVLTAGSTHAGEDEALCAAFREHLQASADTLLILVPRHPERFAAVAALLAESGLRFARHSRGEPVVRDTQVLLGDTLGELILWYGVADACFIGGSLVTRGGHNPLEALCLEKPVLAGPHTANFEFIYAALHNMEGMRTVRDARDLLAQFGALQADPQTARALAARGHDFYLRMAGASQRTLQSLRSRGLLREATEIAQCASLQRGNEAIWFDPQCVDGSDAELFDAAHRDPQNAVREIAAGRGRIRSITDARGAFLIRHYHRGGLLARLNRDLFLVQPLTHTRAMREFTLLGRLRALGLPVPRACAARRTRHGLFYRADIMVQEIPDARDIARTMHGGTALDAQQWHALGHAVRRMHDAQVWHADLNCHNLMLDVRGDAWIVDFDKCRFRGGEHWKQHNLARLLRSLRKELRLDPQFGWKETDWPLFLAGYGSARTN